MSVRSAVMKKLAEDLEFCGLFPDLEAKIAAFRKNPSCPCNSAVVDAITARLTGEPQNGSWHVVDCSIAELEGKLREKFARVSGTFSLAIDGERAVALIREVL